MHEQKIQSQNSVHASLSYNQPLYLLDCFVLFIENKHGALLIFDLQNYGK